MLQRAETPATLAGVDAARAFFAGCFDPNGSDDRLWVAHLDAEAHCLHVAAYAGSAGGDSLPTRAILADAVRRGSAGLLLAQRERGGTRPASHRAATHHLAQAAEACAVTLVDHLVFTGEHCVSMRRTGLL